VADGRVKVNRLASNGRCHPEGAERPRDLYGPGCSGNPTVLLLRPSSRTTSEIPHRWSVVTLQWTAPAQSSGPVRNDRPYVCSLCGGTPPPALHRAPAPLSADPRGTRRPGPAPHRAGLPRMRPSTGPDSAHSSAYLSTCDLSMPGHFAVALIRIVPSRLAPGLSRTIPASTPLAWRLNAFVVHV
jgi:hypothetical protein